MHLEVRIFSVIFYLLLAAFVLDAFTEQLEVKEARTASSDKLRKVYDVLLELRNYLMRLREENPSAVSDCYKTHNMYLSIYVTFKFKTGHLFLFVVKSDYMLHYVYYNCK